MVKRLFHRGFSLRPLKRWPITHWPVFILIGIIAALSFLNYQPGTWLTGWDNLHSEFNFKLNLKSAIFSVWQEKGTGFLAGMSPAADLPRQLFLYFLYATSHMPLANLRYLWTFATLALGPIGVYFLLHHIFLKPKFDPETKKIASFLGALFYLLNLATLQYFFIPFETFSALFAFFPLIILATSLYFENASLKHYLFLLIVLLISSPAFFVQTIFIVLFLCLLPILLSHYHPGKKKLLIFLLTLFITQGYWLLPQIFFVFTNASKVGLSHANLLSSPETFYRNLQFANLKDLALLKGFWFNILDPSGDNKFDYLLRTWRDHLSNPAVLIIGYLSFSLVLTGIYYSLKKKLPFAKAFLGIFLISSFFLLGGGQLLAKLPLVGELFRSPFTKFSIPLAFSYSVFFSVGAIFLLDLFSFLHSRLTYYLTLFTVTLALIIFMTPAFTGNLISPQMRVRTPPEYFELFEFFKKEDPATRIANFPQYTFWGWNYYDWGYRGSGFLWYGIRQPILDRGFDVWEKTGERYYEEISTALAGEDQEAFEKVIDKYAINWILIDKNVIAPNPNQDLGNDKLKNLLDNSSKFTLAKNLNDKILIYKTDVDQKVKNFLSVANPPQEQFPFENLPLRPFPPPSLTADSVTLSSAIERSDLLIRSFTQTENLLPTTVSYRKTSSGLQLKFTPLLPQINLGEKPVNLTATPNIVNFVLPEFHSGLILRLNEEYVEIQLPDELLVQTDFYPLTDIYLPTKERIHLSLYANTPSYRLNLTSAFTAANPYQCFTDKPLPAGRQAIEKIVQGQTISLIGTDMVGCLSVPIPPASGLNQLISLEFSYLSNTGTPANASISDASLGGEASPQPLTAKTKPSFARIFAPARLVNLQANLILEANEIKNSQEISYQNVSVNYLPLLGENIFSLNQLPSEKIAVSEPTTLSVSLPIVPTSLTLSSTPEHSLFTAEARNCDNFNQGKFTRKITPSSLPADRQGFLYSAQNANSCDQVNLKHLPHKVSYALLFDFKNLTGLPTTVCLENYATRRCDIYERLIDGSQILLQPIANENESPGYTLHLSNESFGNQETKNLIGGVTIFPLPLNFLKNITLSAGSEPAIPAGSEPADNSSHPAEFLYTANISWDGSAEGGSSQVISLYQTKSPYWKALKVSEDDLKLPTWKLITKLPYLYFFDKTIRHLPSAMSQDWYNSWNLPSGKHHLVIFYLPQYLEFLGFLLLPFPILGALIWYLVKPNRKK